MPYLNGASNTSGQHSTNEKDQKHRDRLMGIILKRSRNRLRKIKLAKYLIEDLKNYGPAGLVHMEALSSLIGKPIQVWKSAGRFYRTVNNRLTKHAYPINVEYHEQESKSIGHWTLLGNSDPTNVSQDLNSCLFSVIASQTGRNVADLRSSTVNILSNNIKILTDRIDEFVSSNEKGKTLFMFGGARYTKTSPDGAAKILDNSQNALCYGCRYTGHPRGHASDKNASGPKDSVEQYSRSSGSMKSGFLSRKDQNKVAHLALRHEESQGVMRNLNRGAQSQAVTLHASQLTRNGQNLPKMKEFYNGQAYTGELDIVRLTLVLRHHEGRQNDPDADVFVHTFYPRSS